VDNTPFHLVLPRRKTAELLQKKPVLLLFNYRKVRLFKKKKTTFVFLSMGQVRTQPTLRSRLIRRICHFTRQILKADYRKIDAMDKS
jgi:hypothetical protein